MWDKRTDLKLILVVGVSGRKMPELLGQSKAVLHVFWGYKVLCHFYTAVQIVDLQGDKEGGREGGRARG